MLSMWRTVIPYGVALAVAAFALEWLDYKHSVRQWSTGFYVLVIAVLFACVGIWVGNRLTARPRGPFARNEAAIATLGISTRECEVLELLAEGCANKVIARRLGISPNTVKTHVQSVYGKLGVESRTQATAKARELAILP